MGAYRKQHEKHPRTGACTSGPARTFPAPRPAGKRQPGRVKELNFLGQDLAAGTYFWRSGRRVTVLAGQTVHRKAGLLEVTSRLSRNRCPARGEDPHDPIAAAATSSTTGTSLRRADGGTAAAISLPHPFSTCCPRWIYRSWSSGQGTHQGRCSELVPVLAPQSCLCGHNPGGRADPEINGDFAQRQTD